MLLLEEDCELEELLDLDEVDLSSSSWFGLADAAEVAVVLGLGVEGGVTVRFVGSREFVCVAVPVVKFGSANVGS